jgi:hypothetical protein
MLAEVQTSWNPGLFRLRQALLAQVSQINKDGSNPAILQGAISFHRGNGSLEQTKIASIYYIYRNPLPKYSKKMD